MRKLLLVLLILLLLGFLFYKGCMDGKMDRDTTTVELTEQKEIEANLGDNPSKESVDNALKNLSQRILNTKEPAKRKNLLTAGYQLARKYELSGMAVTYLVSYLKEFPDDPKIKDYTFFIGETMAKGGNSAAAEMIMHAFLKRYPSDKRVNQAKAMVADQEMDKDAFIRRIAESMFVDPDKYGLNVTNAQKYVDVCEAHGLVYPNDKMSPEYLYRAGETAVAIRTFPKSLSLYDWLVDFYPQYEKTPNALFAKGYLLDEELGKQERASRAFKQFISMYPNHELADDAQFLLDNVGKSGEELIEVIEEIRAQKEKEVQ